MFADSYPMEEVVDGFFYQVQGKWVEVGDTEVDIGANPSAEEADEGVESTSRKVVDIIDGFRLVEQAGYDKKLFMGYIKPWLGKVIAKLPEDQQDEFKTKAQPAIKFLISKIKDLQFFSGESMDPDATLAYAFYPDGAADPTFLFPKFALAAMKC